MADIDRRQLFAGGFNPFYQLLRVIPLELRINQRHFARAGNNLGTDGKHASCTRIVDVNIQFIGGELIWHCVLPMNCCRE